ncbi:MAG: inositol monophosphatase [Thermoflexales bacterium]|nr:inositol monophosphatase [Thermoflexales bacterium]
MKQKNDCPLSPGDIQQVADWVRQAGQIAMGYFGRVTPLYKADHSFLTQADLEIESFLVERLEAAFPAYGMVSEERAPEGARPLAREYWILDPLDGTTTFVQGLPGWGISLGLLCEGQPCLGMFYMPLLGDLTYTNDANSLYGSGERCLGLAVRHRWGDKSFLAINASAHRDYAIEFRRTRAMGSVGANLVYTARGAAAGAFVSKARVWDLVAGAAILARSGGELRYLSGKKVEYLPLLDGRAAPEPIIAGHPNLLDELQQLIQPRGVVDFGSRISKHNT